MDKFSQFPIKKFFLSIASAAFLSASIPLWYMLISGVKQFPALLLHIFPLLILVIVFSISVILLDAFKTKQKKWLSTLFIVSLLTASSILLQSFLLNHLYRPLLYGVKERVFAQAVSIMVCLAFVVYISALRKRAQTFWILMAFIVAALFLIQWLTFPAKLWRLQPYLALNVSLFIFGLPLMMFAILWGWRWLVSSTCGKIVSIAKITAIILLLILGYFYAQADFKHSNTINIKINSSDQAYYLKFIKNVRNSGFTSTGDHNRMPLYPYLQALFYRPEMSNKELFTQGKTINIYISLVFLGLLFLVFLRYLQFYQSFLLVMIVAFSLYIFKAPFLQAEITFFTLAFLSFLLILEMLVRPSWPLAILTGLVSGLTYLTKGTVLPSLFLFATLFLAKNLLSVFRGGGLYDRARLLTAVQQLGYILACLAIFTLTIYPYIRVMKEKFGQYFYNVNTSIYIWYDSYDQALEEEARYRFTEGWPGNLPQDQIPSLRKYLSDHTPRQILERFQIGVGKVLLNIKQQLGVTNYLLNYAGIFLLAALLDVRNSFTILKKYPYPLIFVILYFAGYLFAFSWYSLIAGGPRFLYGLYIPFLFLVFMSINELSRNQLTLVENKPNKVNLARYFTTVNILMGLTLVYNIWLVLTQVKFLGRFGS